MLRDAIEDKQNLDKARIDLIIVVLNDVVDSPGNPEIKQTVISLVSAYLELRDLFSRTIESAFENGIRADTRELRSECRS